MARSSRKNSSSFSQRIAGFKSIFALEHRNTSLATSIVVGVALAGLLAWGVPKLRSRLLERSLAQAERSDSVDSGMHVVSYETLPAWFDETRQQLVSSRVRSAVGDLSTIDQTRLSRARDAMLSTGWFEDIRQIRLADGGGFLVDASFHTPFAIIRHGEFDFLVTPEGRLMPMEWPAGHRPATPHYVALLGASSAAPAAVGERWSGADVAAGLELARAIASESWYSKIAGIELSRVASENALILVTNDGGRLIWGRAPDDRSVAEVPTETKLRTIDYLFRTTGRVDAGGGRIIDLRGDLVTVRADDVAVGGGEETTTTTTR